MSEVTGSGSGSGRFRKSWNLLKQVPKGPSMLTANSAIEIFLSHSGAKRHCASSGHQKRSTGTSTITNFFVESSVVESSVSHAISAEVMMTQPYINYHFEQLIT